MHDPLIQVKDLCLVSPDGYQVLRGVHCEIFKGDVISIIGPSGGGKSSFLRSLNGLETPTSGEILFGGKRIDSTPQTLTALRRRIGMVFQEEVLFNHLDVLGNLIIGPCKILKMSEKEATERAMSSLRTVGLAERAHARVSSLSGGQNQRVEIARALCMEPDILLFDEPFTGLDPRMVSEVTAVMRDLARSGMTMVIVTHDLKFAREISTRVFFMQDGIIQEQGSPDEIFFHPEKTLTRIFVGNLSSLFFHIETRDYDLYGMNAEIEWFCHRYALGKRYFSLELLLEELLSHILPFTGPVHVRIHCQDDPAEGINIEVEQENADAPILERDDLDELSLMLIRGISPDLREEQQETSRILYLHIA